METLTRSLSPRNRLLGFSIVLNLLSTTQLGYMSSIWNFPRPVIERFFNESHVDHYSRGLDSIELSTLYAISVSAALISSLPFGFVCSWLLDRFGRKFTCIYVFNSVTIVTSIMVSVSKAMNSVELFLIGRFLFGAAESIAYNGVPIYITECSTPQYRGLTGAMIGPSMNIGLIAGTIVSHPNIFGNKDNWPWLTGIAVFPSLLLLALGFCLPESPKYLFINRGREKGARRAITAFSGVSSTETDAILDTFREERDLASKKDWDTLWRTQYIRRGIILSTVAIIGEVSEGWIITDYWSASFFRDVGVTGEFIIYAMLGCQLLSLVGMIVSMMLVDTVGRRPLLNVGLLISAVCMALLMLLFLIQHYHERDKIPEIGWSSIVVFALMSLANASPTTVVPILRAELVPQNVRSTNAAIGSVIGSLLALTLSIFYPILLTIIGPYSFLILLIPLIAATAYLWTNVPETKGRSVDDIVKGLAARNVKDKRIRITLRDSISQIDEPSDIDCEPSLNLVQTETNLTVLTDLEEAQSDI